MGRSCSHVVSTEPRPEEGPRVRQRGLLSSNEIWRRQRYSLSIPCQRVRNQRPEDARRPRAAASTWMPCSLSALGPLAGGSQPWLCWWQDGGRRCLSCSGGRAVPGCPHPLTCQVQRFQGPRSRCPRGDTRQWLSPTVCSSEPFLCTWYPDARTCAGTPVACCHGRVCGSPRPRAPVGLGEVEEGERQFPGQPDARSRDPAPGEEALFGHKLAYS